MIDPGSYIFGVTLAYDLAHLMRMVLQATTQRDQHLGPKVWHKHQEYRMSDKRFWVILQVGEMGSKKLRKHWG